MFCVQFPLRPPTGTSCQAWRAGVDGSEVFLVGHGLLPSEVFWRSMANVVEIIYFFLYIYVCLGMFNFLRL